MDNTATLIAKIDALSHQVAELSAAQRKRDELIADLMPIGKAAVSVSAERLEVLEQKGYFEFGRALLQVLDRIVENYGPDDVVDFADNVVQMLDVVRALTRAEALEIAGELSEAASHTDELDPVGVMGLVRASQEADAQRGMAVLVEVLRRLGKGVRRIERRKKLEEHLGSRLRRNVASGARQYRRAHPRAPRARRAAPPNGVAPAPTPHSAKTSTAASAARGAAPPSAVSTTIGGAVLTSEGFLDDPSQWTPEVAVLLAARLGFTLSDQHWKLIEFARDDYAKTGASPNIRRLTMGSGISTKEIYQMFPKAPGKCTAMVAGLPKPVGCI